MKRKEHLDKIATYLARFEAEVRSFNDMALYDYNIHAENALIPILNLVYGTRLVNTNENGNRTFPAIDLADTENRIAYQVTATADLKKVKDTLSTFTNYKMYEQFDTLYMLILTPKQGSYSSTSLQGLLPETFDFEVGRHIIDLSDIRKTILDIPSLEILAQLAKLLQHEFSDIQISERKKVYQDKFLSKVPEKIFLNFLRIEFPEKIYMADVKIDEEVCADSINGYRRSRKLAPYKTFRPDTLLREAMRLAEIVSSDHIVRENKFITFRNLTKPEEPHRKVVDVNTIIEVNASDYFGQSEAHLGNFKYLLRQTLIDLGYERGLEWIGHKNILRFKNNRLMPRAIKKSWKKKNIAVKTVIFEMMNKKEGHIMCFRNMAFEPSFEYAGGEWYLVINPTWSFTNIGGYKTYRYESSYMTGLKRQERNNTVYYQFRFWCHFFLYPDMQSPVSRFLYFDPMQPFDFAPSIEDGKWLPQKEFKPQNEREAELDLDNELSLKFFE